METSAVQVIWKHSYLRVPTHLCSRGYSLQIDFPNHDGAGAHRPTAFKDKMLIGPKQ